MSTLPAVIETRELATRAQSTLSQVRAIEVVDVATAERAAEYAKLGRAMEKEIHALLDPICQASDRAHKVAVAQREALLALPVEIKELAADKVTTWQREQERLRREAEAQASLAQIAAEIVEQGRVDAERTRLQREEESRRLDAAEAAEARGDFAAAEQIIAQPVVVPPVQPRPVFVPPVAVPPAPTIAGVSSRTDWDAEVVDPDAIPRAYLIPDMVAIRKVVRALKGRHGIPGIRAVEKPVSAVRP